MSSKINTPTLLPAYFSQSEKGNTLVLGENGAFASWINLGEGKHLEITYAPDNSPSLEVGVVRLTDKQLFKHLNSERMLGWTVMRANFVGSEKLRTDSNGVLVPTIRSRKA